MASGGVQTEAIHGYFYSIAEYASIVATAIN
jgi:hypothetical protein